MSGEIRSGFVLAALLSSAAACRDKKPVFHDAAPRPAPGALRGTFALTYYWVATQASDDHGTVALTTTDCKTVASVSDEYADDLFLSGTGRLLDGRVLGVIGDCTCSRSPCVRVLPPEQPWGVGIQNRPLVPFVSLAADRDVLPIGTHLYVPELDGARLPGATTTHDGCVVVDDTGARMRGHRVDWFVGSKAHYRELHASLQLRRLTIHDGAPRCPADR